MGKGRNRERVEDSKNGNSRKETGGRKEGLWQKKAILKICEVERGIEEGKEKRGNLCSRQKTEVELCCVCMSECIVGIATDGYYTLLKWERKCKT